MPYETAPGNPETSMLKIEHIVFNELSFVRHGFKGGHDKIDLSLGVNTEPYGDSQTRVTLNFAAEKKDEYTVKISISGFCSVDSNAEAEIADKLLKKNAVAIMFPYVRAQLTLLTAQPETDPIVLPAINVHGLLDDIMKESN